MSDVLLKVVAYPASVRGPSSFLHYTKQGISNLVVHDDDYNIRQVHISRDLDSR
jgi:hypothetical protein